MKRFLAPLLESPTTEADGRDLFASWRIGVWVSILIAHVAAATFATGAAFFTSERPVPEIVARTGIGAVLVAATQLALASFLTLAIPIRVAGLLEGPRWRGYFDQLVASGIAPWRYFAGRALVAQAFIGISIAATLPAVALFTLVDPPALTPVVVGYVHLVIYAELVLAVVLGLASLVHEVAAVIATVVLGTALGLAAISPLPSAIAAISPVRGIIAPFVLHLPDEDLAFIEALYGAPRILGLEVPLIFWSLVLSGAFGALAALSCVFGPRHAFAPGLNSFGAVVFPGDKGRAAIRRIRPILARRAEIAFFFENRGTLLGELAPYARAAQIGGLLVLIGGLLLVALTEPSVVRAICGNRPDEEVLLFVPCALVPVALLGPWLLASSKSDARLSLYVGRLAVPVALADAAVFALVAAALTVLTLALFARIPATVVPRNVTFVGLVLAAVEWAAIIGVVGLTAVLLQKVFGLRTWGRVPGAVLGIVLVSVTPLLLVAVEPRDLAEPVTLSESLLDEAQVPRHDPASLRDASENARTLTALHVAFPLRMMLAITPDALRDVNLPRRGPWLWLAKHGFWVLYPGLDLLLALGVLQLVRLRRDEARREGEVPP